MVRLLSALLVAASAPVGLRSDPMQDRADLPNSVDTWYRVLQGRRPVGYLHETLTRTARPWRYEYAFQAEFELTLRGKPHAEDHAATAFLDDAFLPVEFSSESRVNDVATGVSLFSGGDGGRMRFHPSSGDPVSWTRPAGEEVHALPSLMLYALRQNESLGKPGRIAARLIDPRGLEKSGVEVLLEVAERVQREVLGRPAPVLPVTFLKPFPAGSRETEIREAFVDRYGRILEASMGSGVRIVIARDRTEALAGTGLVPRLGRGDPFDKAAAMRNAALERLRAARGGPDVVPPHVTLDSLQSDLNAAAKMVEEIRVRRSAGELEEARQAYARALVHLKAIRELAAKRRPELLPAIDQSREDAEAQWDGAAQLEREARALYVRAHRHLEREDGDALEQARRELAHLRDRIEVERRPERNSIARWASEVEALGVRCRTRMELARTRLDISGITTGQRSTAESIEVRTTVFGHQVGILEEVRFMRPVLLAEINGEIYRTGDTIRGTGIRVDRISRQSVQVSLRDEVRDVGLRR